ncbi:MAG: DUF2461 domain-containing protein [Oscillospiraceae bacterium]|nr:DUF2461 domain-containing protein [Oscillospiraceae bacterium]MBP3521069.1 DUF2461 domain-containing protein [Oscillospiraceae bacterium]
MFQGFDPRAEDFLWGIRFNNEKPWFEHHKQEYLDYIYDPMKELTRQVYQNLQKDCEGLGLSSKVSRIYRDARRLHGRGPYKDHLWLAIERPRGPFEGGITFWFELAPEGYSYGLGYWDMPPLTAAKFRARLDRDPKEFEKLARGLKNRPDLVLKGESYKRPKGAAPSKLLEEWYNLKNFSISHEGPYEDKLFRPGLADELTEAYRFLMPLCRYFLLLDGDKDPREV